ncbi:MAG: RNA-binding transcriptional accessory protein [Prevotellaceae bacterium]|jgi:uncharacterized protein|nr:RNA-binding transcriptional accessory protein [Prevotellaceae bacterium]
MIDISASIALTLALPKWQIDNVLQLLGEGAAIPFISRYRKEKTGGLDEVRLADIKQQHEKLLELIARKETILKSIGEQGKLTDELKLRIESRDNLSELEDIYLPYKPKRRTRATIAKEKGLEPLAAVLMKQGFIDVASKAESYINEKVGSVEDALSGARDIIAEWISERARARNTIRRLFVYEGMLKAKLVKGKEEEGVKFKDYFDYSEPIKRIPSHRFLAVMRGTDEGFLKLSVEPDVDKAIEELEHIFLKDEGDAALQVSKAVADSYKRLLAPSIENEVLTLTKERADEEAIRVFAENLRQLLLASPLGQRNVLAIDPGYRTGCKVVCLDRQGTLLHNETIYPHPPQNERTQAAKKMSALVEAYEIEAIAIGNGTAGRETEHFIKNLHLDRKVRVFVVSEDGASIYSASSVAREEFPQYDVTVRGAVSIGRRLMDPLAELVKIDPKSIGVGQYQHDVDQAKLKKSLDMVVEACVNSVGVNLNTASKHLLTYVSGLGPQLATNIVEYRKENGSFTSREELKKVTRLGAKAFEQSSGFLRIPNAENPLDASAVHPESYCVVEQMAKHLSCTVNDLLQSEDLRAKIKLADYVTDKVGLPTLNDIMSELAKPGRDPRTVVKVFEFDSNAHKIEDLIPGMILPGIVTNITNFGAFVDVGVKQDGLVHISQLADRFVANPNDVVRLRQQVQVKVLEVDVSRRRIQLSMKEVND